MPEVVEVALTALYLNHQLKNKKITKISILSGRYTRYPLAGIQTIKSVLPLTIVKVDSKGKFLWFELSKPRTNKKYYIMNTFGLEGQWSFTKTKHSRIAFKISNGQTLYFTDSRNFGTMIFTSDEKKIDTKLSNLAPDLLKESFTNQDFYDRIEDYLFNKKGHIISSRKDKKIIQVLMEQTNSKSLGSGLGNYLAVEVLYDSKISPHKTIYEIYSDKRISNRLANSIRRIVKQSFLTSDIGYLSELDKDMFKFITNLRQKIEQKYHKNAKIGKTKFKFRVYRQKLDPKGNKIKAEKNIVKGRTTYWSPKIQS